LALIAKVHDTSEHFRELELNFLHEQKLVTESRATILEQQQIIYDLESRIQALAASNEQLDMVLMSQKKKAKIFSIPKSQNWTESNSNRQTAA
jgi:cell division protein FtsL